MPPGLEELICSDNQLTELPELVNYFDKTKTFELSYLKRLECDNNKIDVLPKLPNKLKKLKCGNNRLSELPELLIQ